MQLHLERPDYQYFLRGADGDHALVNERSLRSSFIVAPDALIEDWHLRDITALSVADLEPMLALNPELIVLGSGATQAFPPPVTLAACLQRGVGLEAMTNAAAARTYNVLAAEGRRVVAALVFPAS
jgi:uncharacterized protein